MARHVLTSYQVSADVVTPSIEIGGRYTRQTWLWKFTTSGTGANTLAILVKQVANWKQSETDHVLFSLSAAKLYRGPRIITPNMVDQAPDTTLLASYTNPATPGAVKVDFDYGGAGSRTWTVDLWIEG